MFGDFVVLFVREGKEKQRVCIKFCVKLRKTFTETFQMLQKAFEDECLSRSKCHKWFKRFKEGWVSIADDPRSGRLTGVSTDDVHVSQDKLPCAFESTSNHLRNGRRMQHLIWFKPRNLKKKTAHASSGEMKL